MEELDDDYREMINETFPTECAASKVSSASEDNKENIFSSADNSQVLGSLDEYEVLMNKTSPSDERITDKVFTKAEKFLQLNNCCSACNKQFKYIGR